MRGNNIHSAVLPRSSLPGTVPQNWSYITPHTQTHTRLCTRVTISSMSKIPKEKWGAADHRGMLQMPLQFQWHEARLQGWERGLWLTGTPLRAEAVLPLPGSEEEGQLAGLREWLSQEGSFSSLDFHLSLLHSWKPHGCGWVEGGGGGAGVQIPRQSQELMHSLRTNAICYQSRANNAPSGAFIVTYTPPPPSWPHLTCLCAEMFSEV